MKLLHNDGYTGRNYTGKSQQCRNYEYMIDIKIFVGEDAKWIKKNTTKSFRCSHHRRDFYLYVLSEEITEWLKETLEKFTVSYRARTNDMRIYFQSKSDAALFKLTWG